MTHEMRLELDTFYRNKRVFVTGHTGFKGGWLTAWLQAMGAEVIGFALPGEGDASPITEWAGVTSDAVLLAGDINDYQSLADAMKKHAPDIVLHLAAQTLVRRSYREPVWTFATNVMGTAHVLEAIRQVPSVRAAVMVTSDKCYENNEWPWGYREVDPLGGHDPYSASKGAAEIVTHAYRRSYFNTANSAHIASGRAGNVIGGGDWCEDRLVPDIFRGLVRKQPIVLRNPRSVRPWQHVLEPLGGYLHLAQQLWERGAEVGGGWNFGPSSDDTLRVADVCERIVSLWGSGEIIVQQDPNAPHEAGLLTLDCSKARTALGWTPILTHREALRLTVEWYRGFADDKASVGAITRRQIEQYSAALAGRGPVPGKEPAASSSGRGAAPDAEARFSVGADLAAPRR